MIEITIPCVPVAQPRQRHAARVVAGRAIVRNYTPAKHPVQSFKAACQLAYHMAAGNRPPLTGPVRIEVAFILPRPKQLVWKSKPMPRVRHTAKPDLDNLIKAVKDALTGLAWRDDAQVCEVVAAKWVASGYEQPRCVVRISPADLTEDRPACHHRTHGAE